jgi:hypothetical protein
MLPHIRLSIGISHSSRLTGVVVWQCSKILEQIVDSRYTVRDNSLLHEHLLAVANFEQLSPFLDPPIFHVSTQCNPRTELAPGKVYISLD